MHYTVVLGLRSSVACRMHGECEYAFSDKIASTIRANRRGERLRNSRANGRCMLFSQMNKMLVAF